MNSYIFVGLNKPTQDKITTNKSIHTTLKLLSYLVLIIMLTVLSMTVFSQGYLGFGAGYSSRGYKLIELNPGAKYNIKGLEIHSDLIVRYEWTRDRDITSDKERNGNSWLGGKVGINIMNSENERYAIVPMFGYYYRLSSSDNTSINGHNTEYSIKWIYKTDHGLLYAETIYINRSYQMVLGIAAIID